MFWAARSRRKWLWLRFVGNIAANNTYDLRREFVKPHHQRGAISGPEVERGVCLMCLTCCFRTHHRRLDSSGWRGCSEFPENPIAIAQFVETPANYQTSRRRRLVRSRNAPCNLGTSHCHSRAHTLATPLSPSVREKTCNNLHRSSSKAFANRTGCKSDCPREYTPSGSRLANT